ncbi:MAG: pseudaminic acid cytidylyltransferase [Bacteroidota bacterium]|nr:pseudaminic acid cytidylyltransferase [Bacteroidota bacterium]MDP3145226.1 pseudaminic acid cytidylyltransferase [Bacteroidota bacterium]MDP3557249.1 pseudaminic acid cytidylyltransferase [Bacteroidota bacterium]
MTNVAIIIARGGSKRIPRKNIKLFRGKPIIAYSIESALNSGLFDYVMVSTDDDEIAEVAKKSGAQVPFIRSKKNSDDFSTTADVIIEVLNDLKNNGKQFDNVCCIYPTAPFITKQTLSDAYHLLISDKFESVFPVCPFSYPIQRALDVTDSKVTMIIPENLNKRSQDLNPTYHDAGQFYWLRTEKFLREKKVFTQNSGSIILNELQVQDIDNETDWKIAELKHSILFPSEH